MPQGPLPPPLSSILSLLRRQISGHGMLLLIQPNDAKLSPHCLLIVVCPINSSPPPLWSSSSSLLSSLSLSSSSFLWSFLLLSLLLSLSIAHVIGQQWHLCLCQLCWWDGLCHAPPPLQSYLTCRISLTCCSIAHLVVTPPLTVITIIGWLLFFILTGSVNDTGFVALLFLPPSSPSPLCPSPSPPSPTMSSCSHWLLPLSVDCYLVNGGQSKGKEFVIADVWLLSCSSPPPPSFPLPLTSLACPSTACCVLGLPLLVDCYFQVVDCCF